MITNERQYLNTRAMARRFEEALTLFDEQNAALDPTLRQAMRKGIEGELEDLQAQLAQYEAVRTGDVRSFSVDNFDELPDILVLARIAGGLTQKRLAEELGVKEQQIQRYEATHYAKAAFERLADIAAILGLQIHVQASLPEQARQQQELTEYSMLRTRKQAAAAEIEKSA